LMIDARGVALEEMRRGIPIIIRMPKAGSHSGPPDAV
jgi:hypothetical protein